MCVGVLQNIKTACNMFYPVVVCGKTWIVKGQLQQMLVSPVSCYYHSVYEFGRVNFHLTGAKSTVWKKHLYSMFVCSHRGLSLYCICAFSPLISTNHPNVCVCFFTRYLEWTIIPDRPWPASRMEEDHRHGRYLLLAHSYRHHPVGEACHPPSTPWTDRVPGPGRPHSLHTT